MKKNVNLHRNSDETGCGAVGSVLRSGRRGRSFESCHPDFAGEEVSKEFFECRFSKFSKSSYSRNY